MLRIIGSLSSEVFFEGAPQPEVSLFSLLICLDATKFVLLAVFTLIETICPNICSKSRLKIAKSQLPVYVRRSKPCFLNPLIVSQFTLKHLLCTRLCPVTKPVLG